MAFGNDPDTSVANLVDMVSDKCRGMTAQKADSGRSVWGGQVSSALAECWLHLLGGSGQLLWLELQWGNSLDFLGQGQLLSPVAVMLLRLWLGLL